MTLPDHLQALVDELVSRGEIRPLRVTDSGDITITEPVFRRLLQGAWEYGRLSVLPGRASPADPDEPGVGATSFDGERPASTPGESGGGRSR